MALAAARRSVRVKGSFGLDALYVPPYISGAFSQPTAQVTAGYGWLLVDNASRLYDWENYCGIPGGIPTRTTIYTSLGLAGQVPTYAQSVTAAQINSAISACPADQVVYLYPGTYSIGQIVFPIRLGMTLRGAGPGQTIIRPSGTTTQITATSNYYSESSGIVVSSGYTKGSMAIVLASTPTSNFVAGNNIVISEDNSHNKWGADIGIYLRDYEAYGPRIYNLDSYRNSTYTSRILSVVGNTINLASPIPCSFSTTNIKAYVPDGPQPVSMCGVENLTLDGNNVAMGQVATFWNVDRCWFKDVEVKNYSGGDIGHLRFENGFQCEIRRVYLHDCVNFPNQADGQGIGLNSGCNNLIIDSIAYRVASLVQFDGATANAFVFNHTEDLGRSSGGDLIQPAILQHGVNAVMNLSEGNVLTRVELDGYHGSCAFTTFFRNQVHGVNFGMPTFTWMRQLIELKRWSYYVSCVGNILGHTSWNPTGYESHARGTWDTTSYIYNLGTDQPGITCSYYTKGYPDPDVDATLLRHGNYDYYNDAAVWDGGITSHSIPDSLFYSSKPAFFGSLAWPAIGPDLGTMVNPIPAKSRWDAYAISADLDDLFADQA